MVLKPKNLTLKKKKKGYNFMWLIGRENIINHVKLGELTICSVEELRQKL